MTGNSMDAIDLVLTEFDNNNIKDICSFSTPYTKDMQQKIEYLRKFARSKTKSQIENIPNFKEIHNEYISQIASSINQMLETNNIDKSTISAIGFHGKTLDHNPPSVAKQNNTTPYTVQLGSGQMLANLTLIPVIYDFRSDFIKNGFEGAPLIAPHNARISLIEGDGCYYNGGNTSNFAIIKNNTPIFTTDSGPFNEYIDNFIRLNTPYSYDIDGMYGKKGKLDKSLIQELFNIGLKYYNTPLPKSGDPSYYHKQEVFDCIQSKNISYEDAIHSLEYFSAYISVYTLTQTPKTINIPHNFILFGGGWKNPIVFKYFKDLLSNKAYILPQHKEQFNCLYHRLSNTPCIKTSKFGNFMEARLMADLAYHKLENKPWKLPETILSNKEIICGKIALPNNQTLIQDTLSSSTLK